MTKIEDSKEPINFETELIERDEVWYTKDNDKPYSGKVFSLHEGGEKESEGTFKDGEKDGKWTHWDENGQKMQEGTCKDGKADGHFTYWYENALKEFEGSYKDGKKDGNWTYWYENGQKKVEGTYKNDVADGEWTYWPPYTSPEFHENRYSKMIWKDGKMWNGKCISFYTNSPRMRIESIYRNGKEHGNWVYWSPDGKECSEIIWKDGKKWNGKLTKWIDRYEENIFAALSEPHDLFGLKAHEEIYEDYKLTKKRDFWPRKKADWDINKTDKIAIERTYKDGFLEKITRWDRSGFLSRIEINEDKPALPSSPHDEQWDPFKFKDEELSNYKAIVFHRSGEIEGEATYKRGKVVGEFTYWHIDGQLRGKITYKDGKEHGTFHFCHINGQKSLVYTCKNGKKDGLETYWYENGQKESEGTYKDGKEDGTFTSWKTNGQKTSITTYKNRLHDGKYIRWYDNGNISVEGAYKNNWRRVGKWTYWYENGQKKKEGTYKEGWEKVWDSKEGKWINYNEDGSIKEVKDYGKD